MDSQHKRLCVNIDTGDFVAGQFNEQLDEDFIKLCTYDCLLKLDISEYYGKIYTHYLDLDNYSLMDNVLSSLYNGRTSGLLMGNYLSLYFAEYVLSKISQELQDYIDGNNINCEFNYFSMTSISFAMKMILKRLLTFLTMHLKNLILAEKKKNMRFGIMRHIILITF